jgi:cytochrome c553
MRLMFVLVLAALAVSLALVFTKAERTRTTLATAPHPTQHQPLPPHNPLAARAAIIAQSCATCHGTEGRLHTAIPSLAGKPEIVLRAQLLAFRQDAMPDATVMPRLLKGFSDEELEAVARHFSKL